MTFCASHGNTAHILLLLQSIGVCILQSRYVEVVQFAPALQRCKKTHGLNMRSMRSKEIPSVDACSEHEWKTAVYRLCRFTMMFALLSQKELP